MPGIRPRLISATYRRSAAFFTVANSVSRPSMRVWFTAALITAYGAMRPRWPFAETATVFRSSLNDSL